VKVSSFYVTININARHVLGAVVAVIVW